METPVADFVRAYVQKDPVRLHMPGHKGIGEGLFSEITPIDFTEIAPTGNLYTGEGAITEAEALCANYAGAKSALFFTCGSTQGIYTMLAEAVGMGGELILERGCHKSVYNAMALLDITPHYIYAPPISGTPLSGAITPELVEDALCRYPASKAVFLTSPTYYGVVTDLAPISALCHRHSVFLLVDQAHGAHFPSVGLPSAPEQGVDLVVEHGLGEVQVLGQQEGGFASRIDTASELGGDRLGDFRMIAGQHHDRRARGHRVAPEAPAGLDPVQPRHVHVQEDDLGPRAHRPLDRLEPVPGLLQPVAGDVLERGGDQLPDHRVVVDDQDPGDERLGGGVDGAEQGAGGAAESAEDGSFSFENIPYGVWLVREIAAPAGYVLSDEILPVQIGENGQTVGITVTNRHIPEIPTAPPTGERSALGFWLGLGSVALGGVIACAIMYGKRKKDEDDER